MKGCDNMPVKLYKEIVKDMKVINFWWGNQKINDWPTEKLDKMLIIGAGYHGTTADVDVRMPGEKRY